MLLYTLSSILLLIIIGYIVVYLQDRKYLETFRDDSPQTQYNPDINQQQPNSSKINPPEKPYILDPLDSVDDYEVSAVFRNQATKEASRLQISDAMTRYPLDWSVHPPNSQHFQENYINYQNTSNTLVDNRMKPLYSQSDKHYRVSSKHDALLDDKQHQDLKERQILQTYIPEKSSGLLKYSLDDVKSLVDRVYTRKGLVPTIEKSSQGENIWEITEVSEKNPRIVWEDEINTTRGKMTRRGEETIEIPYNVSDVAAGLDPFYEKNRTLRDNKYDYAQWTPGLERMFAPTSSTRQWL
jgi:hypothetical protein